MKMTTITPIYICFSILLFDRHHLTAWSYQPKPVVRKPSQGYPWTDDRHEYCQATIDYSSANDYIKDQYAHVIPHQPYFLQEQQRESIYNARLGVFDERSQRFRPAALDFCGFEVLHHPAQQVADWRDLVQIRQCYLPRLRRTIQKHFESEKKIREIVFWHPVLRGEQFTCARRFDQEEAKTANMAVADVAHIDIDFGAYEDVHGIADLVYKNHIREADRPPLCCNDLADLLTNRRFTVINAWRNVLPQPIQSAPLALLHTHYDNGKHQLASFPDVVPCPKRSRWYTYPQLTKDEVLLFYQYDRKVSKISDLWHTALPEIQEVDCESKRKSFDVRMLIVFDEEVPPGLDRFHPNRTRAKPEEADEDPEVE